MDKIENKNRTWLSLIILFAILGFAGWLRYNLIDVPLERDEGEYAYGGQLLLKGIPPYQNLYNMKLPGIYAAYAFVIAIFGHTHTGIHLGLLAANILAGIFIYLLTKRVAGVAGGLAATLAFSIFSIGQPVQGIFANSEHFVIVPMLAGMYFLLKSKKENLFGLFLAGFCLGGAFLIKQHGLFFILCGGLYLLMDCCFGGNYSWKKLIKLLTVFSAGVFTPYIVTCLLLWQAGVFDNFWFWTMDYARAYTGQVPWGAAMVNLKSRAAAIFAVSPLIWIIAIFGLPVALFSSKNWQNRFFIISFVLFSFLSLCPGFYFRPHYFVLFLPAASLLFGVFIGYIVDLPGWKKGVWRYGAALVIVAISCSFSIYKQRTFLFKMSPDEVLKTTYWPNPFGESLAIAKFIKERTKESDKIAIIGSEPQIYFYANRQSASGYIYMYPLMENHDFALEMQKQLIKEVEENTPEFMVFVRVDLSWLQRKDSNTLIYKWFEKYKENYDRVGLVEIYNKSTLYFFEPNVKWPPTSPYWLEILKRKS